MVELTSGNTGTGLAIVCGIKGYPFVAVMSKGNSVERARMMSALGAEVVLVDQLPSSVPGQVSGGDLERVERETRRIVKERGAFRADQFQLRGNYPGPITSTPGRKSSSSPVDISMCFAISPAPVDHLPAAPQPSKNTTGVKCFVVEPEGAAILAGEPVTYPNHRIQGGGYAMSHLPMLNPAHVDGYLQVSDRQAVDRPAGWRERRYFCRFFVGHQRSCRHELLKTSFKGKTAVVLICDSGLKYLSTDLWE